jgi:hypothetical protein
MENDPGTEELEFKARRAKQFNFFGSIGLLVFALAYLIAAFQIKNMSNAKWYESPNLFPIIIGGLLSVFCVVYLLQNLAGRILTAEDQKNIVLYLKGPVFRRLVIAIALLAVYVFVLLKLRFGSFEFPYEAATFIYLFSTMLIFRTKNYAIWKIIVISLAVSFGVSLIFTQGAKIPLP